jgi:hypothetical protein
MVIETVQGLEDLFMKPLERLVAPNCDAAPNPEPSLQGNLEDDFVR